MISHSKPHIMLLAGETSGDAHAAAVVHEIKKIQPDILFTGIGGQEMKQEGVQLFFDSARIAVMGIFEVLKHWRDIRQAMTLVKQQIKSTQPDLLILVDYPGFNLKIAAYAKSINIKVLYYISPKVWASRPKRIQQIAQCVDHMAVIFKFETDIFQQANIPVTFVGNPLVDKVQTSNTEHLIRQGLQINSQGRIVGLFPGSRESELSRLLPVLLQTAVLMSRQDPSLNFVIPVAADLDFDAIKMQCDRVGINITPTQDNLYDVIHSCDAIVSCSGTVTLEIGLLGIPVCVIYKLSWLSYQIISRIITVPYISLINIIAQEQVVQELLQDKASAKAISAELFKLLDDTQYKQQVLHGLQKVKDNLGPGEGSKKMAELSLSLMTSTSAADSVIG